MNGPRSGATQDRPVLRRSGSRRRRWEGAVVRTSAILAMVLLAALPCARAAQQGDSNREEQTEHGRRIGLEEANRLVAQGVIRLLSEVVATALRRVPGELIDADLFWLQGRYVYEVEILNGGRRSEIYLDAATLETRGEE
jgi:uncharacterized membrane protein YkoI